VNIVSRLADRPGRASAALAGVGALGSVLVARASYVVGALPGHHLDRTVATGPWRWTYEIGVALLVLAWLGLGRLALDPSVTGTVRRVCWSGACMAAPLLVAAPVTSQDVWSYLGQANVSVQGLDPYAVGPNSVPGPFADSVAHAWAASPSPYGPLWIGICRVVVEVAQPHPWVGMFLLRLVAVAGLAGLAAALALLCRATGQRTEVALWLAVTGPFPLLMVLGGLHNDAVMLALLLAGVAAAANLRSRRTALLAGAVLVGLAAAVKAVALVALPVLPLIWLRYAAAPRDGAEPAPRRRLGAATACLAVGATTLLMSGWVLGTGSGWTSHVGDGKVGVRWLSLPQLVADVLHVLSPDRVGAAQAARYGLVHPLGLCLLALALGVAALTAGRRPPLQTLALVLLALVVTSPAPRAWYLLWPLLALAAERLSPRAVALVAGASATLALWLSPSVQPTPPTWLLGVLFVPLALVATLAARTRPRARAPQLSV
jgi:alpha-1,6-mannosyltransferase